MTVQEIKFRPKAKIIRTLGDELIKDSYAAIIELVKNAYDADAKNVTIEFNDLNNKKKASIIITDDGHGMDLDTVLNKWMIPGTDDKHKRRFSPKKRKMLGKKGIGRLAAAKLGRKLKVETTALGSPTVLITIDWSIFEKDSFLDELVFSIDEKTNVKESGTKLSITEIDVDVWTEQKIVALNKELRKLLSPVSTKTEVFNIFFILDKSKIRKFEQYGGQIEPFPVLDYFDYRLHGSINKDGNGMLTFINGIDQRIPDELITIIDIQEELQLYKNLDCGNIEIDLRVFDRDPSSIDELIKRSELRDKNKNYLNKTEARKLLNELSGVGIYRGDFRIRPHGDAGYDWLELDKRRVQNPSFRIGSNQISGYITIEEEEISNLKEKSSREGLIEDVYYDLLKEKVLSALSKLEERRFSFRQKTGRGRPVSKLTKALETFFDFSNIERNIDKMNSEGVIDENIVNSLKESIEKDKKDKEKDYKEILDVIARYEGQITLGKIVGVVIHEGRKPVTYFRETSPRIIEWINCITKININFDDCVYNKNEIIDDLSMYVKSADKLKDLYDKLTPLAGRKRPKAQRVDVCKTIKDTRSVFSSELRNNKIKVIPNCKNIYTHCIEDDLLIALANLMDNSIYWLKTYKNKYRTINIECYIEHASTIIDFVDNGPGIKEQFRDVIFEPHFSTKLNGTGLGLSIAGEALSRNNGEISLLKWEGGAFFRIRLPKGNDNG